MTFRLPFILFLAFLVSSCNHKPETAFRLKMPLAGDWQFSPDTLESGKSEKWFSKLLPETVKLPGTMDENGKGIKNVNFNETMRLSRELMYEGWAWYRKEVLIPESWRGKTIRLVMERTKPTTVWADTILAGSKNAILTRQVYDLTGMLTPGSHILTILVNNGPGSVPPGITGSHAWTEHTQTNWNGIIGDFCLEALNPDHIESVKVYPDIVSKSLLIKAGIFLSGDSDKKAEVKVMAYSGISRDKQNFHPVSFPIILKPGINTVELTYKPGGKARLWSEFDPACYKLSVSLYEKIEVDNMIQDFGLRKFSTKGTQFAINDIVTFLRGKHDACVFPLTAHPPMDVESWRKVFRIAKLYNINFFRFHSWTPPEAAFEAADIEGIYLQPELPFWGSLRKTDTTGLNDFLLNTGDKILEEYGNHPSFVMFSLGNELSGDQEVMNSFVSHFRSTDGRPLMAFGSNNFLGYHGHAAGEDYYAACRVGPDTDTTYSTHIRASFSFADAWEGGYINGRYPSTDLNYSGAIARCSVPATGTEVGQYQVYPDYTEIHKYTGVLKPWNFIVFKNRLEQSHLGDQANDFFRASGALSVICYRADIEMALRTPGFGGFHLLDLQDFPGQGTALVGILDAFMDSKGLVTPEEFGHFCNKVVPLLVINKFCWTNNEMLKAKIQVSNYSEKCLESQPVSWSLRNSKNEILAQGEKTCNLEQGKLTYVTGLDIELGKVNCAEKIILNIKLAGTPYENSYPLWIYPQNQDIKIPDGMMVTSKLSREAIDALTKGEKVLLFPDEKDIKDQSVGGLFTTDYWNYRMFRGISESLKKSISPGTMGILTNPDHPIFADFPTEFHTNWQWWSIIRNSRPLILDNTPVGYKPVIQVIDNIERNHKLGLVFEFAVDKGKLLVCASDLRKILDKPEARQLYASILKYMASDKFNPSQALTAKEITIFFKH